MKSTASSATVFFAILAATCSVHGQPSQPQRYYDLPIRDVNTNDILRTRQQHGDDDLPLTFSGDVDKIIEKANNRAERPRSDEQGDNDGDAISVPTLSASTQPPAMTHNNNGSDIPVPCPSAAPSTQSSPTFDIDNVPTLSSATKAPASSTQDGNTPASVPSSNPPASPQGGTGGAGNSQGNTPSSPAGNPSNLPVESPTILPPTPAQPTGVSTAGGTDYATAPVQAPVLLPSNTNPGAGSSSASNAPAASPSTSGTPGTPSASSSGPSTPATSGSTNGTPGTPTSSALLPTLSEIGSNASPTASSGAAPSAVDGGVANNSPGNGEGPGSSPTVETAAAPSGATSSPSIGITEAPTATSGNTGDSGPGNGDDSTGSGSDGNGSDASTPTSHQDSPSLVPLPPTPAPQTAPSAQSPIVLSPTVDSVPGSQATTPPQAGDPSPANTNGASPSSNASPTSTSNVDDPTPTAAAAANGKGDQTTGNSEQSPSSSPVAAPTMNAAEGDSDGPTPAPHPVGPPTPQSLVVGENTLSLQEDADGQASNPGSSSTGDLGTNMDLLPDGDGPMLDELVSIPPAAAPAGSLIPEIFPVLSTLISCDGSDLERPETIEFSYSLETSKSDFEEIERIRKLSELSLSKDISNLLLGCKARRLQSGDALGFEGIDHVPEDTKAEEGTCDTTEDIRNTCTVFDGILTIYISPNADFELAKYYTLTAIREAMGLLDGQVPGLSKATYLGPDIVNPSAFGKQGDGPSSITPGPSNLNTSLVLFAVGGCAFAASVGLIYYLRRNGNYSSSGGATQAAGSDRQTGMLDVDRPLSPFSEMLPSAYRFDQDGNMSAILELDDESATQRSGIVVSDSGFTTDEEGSIAISMGGTSPLDRLDSPILGARKRHDETMDSLLEFL